MGGGDGGVLREVSKYPSVERIVMCEIDEGVVNVAKKYFNNSTAVAFDDPRVELVWMVVPLDLSFSWTLLSTSRIRWTSLM